MPQISVAQTGAADRQQDRVQPSHYVGAAPPVTAAHIYGQGVRETKWRSPEEERTGFHLPPGFSIELVAAEPDISKPLNMAWGPKGRLWVSCTVEYPYPATDPSRSRDSIRILEDSDGDGALDRAQVFADRLNIPMGLLPVADGVICFSIPNIWYLKDLDGDGRVDERVPLYGPFDTSRDTHGMVNSFRDGGDGWIYACHGFSNHSFVEARDGSRVDLSSGNTFRFRADGSRIEQFTQGQVNPFGLTRDEFGHWYSADCHSKPLSALLRGACYSSFGRPHDGLGFAPEMMEHLHGSTAISGVAYTLDQHFPRGYRRIFLSGNVMTSRLNANQLTWQGATAKAVELPDFLTSDDPWFRPVDVQLGPDGAVYVADFYNKIIGHYEVPLRHPGRDRDSGRIWRITYEGERAHAPLRPVAGRLGEPAADNPVRIRSQVEHLVAAKDLAGPQLQVNLAQLPLAAQLHVLFRRGELRLQHVRDATTQLATIRDVHPETVTQVLAGATRWPKDLRHPLHRFAEKIVDDVVRQGQRVHPQVVRAAVETLGEGKDLKHLKAILSLQSSAKRNPAMEMVCKLAVRSLLRAAESLDEERLGVALTPDAPPQSVEAKLLLEALPHAHTPVATNAYLKWIGGGKQADGEQLDRAILLAAHQPDTVDASQVMHWILEAASQARPTEATEVQTACRVAELAADFCERARAGQSSPPEPVLNLARRLVFDGYPSTYESTESSRPGLVMQLAAQLEQQPQHWWADEKGRSWQLQTRSSTDAASLDLMSSHTMGEPYLGELISESFPCPAEIQFWIAGHNGHPESNDHRKNRVSLIRVSTGERLFQAFPPRRDIAQLVRWDTAAVHGDQVRLHITDGVSDTAYAWIAVGQFSVPELNPSKLSPMLPAFSRLARAGCLVDHEQRFLASLSRSGLGPRSLARLTADLEMGAGRALAGQLLSEAIALDRLDLFRLTEEHIEHEELVMRLATELAVTATGKQPRRLAKILAGSQSGQRSLKRLLESGSLRPSAVKGLHGVLGPELSQWLDLQQREAPSVDEQQLAERVEHRLAQLPWDQADLALGQQLYQQHCAICHQLAGAGKLVGPQLDGAVVRGVQRLGEDILLPNRNVDRAFRVTRLLLDDDSIVSGLLTPLTEQRVMLTNAQGEAQTISEARIVERKIGQRSLMPDNFGEILSDRQLASLMQYLVTSQRSTPR